MPGRPWGGPSGSCMLLLLLPCCCEVEAAISSSNWGDLVRIISIFAFCIGRSRPSSSVVSSPVVISAHACCHCQLAAITKIVQPPTMQAPTSIPHICSQISNKNPDCNMQNVTKNLSNNLVEEHTRFYRPLSALQDLSHSHHGGYCCITDTAGISLRLSQS